MHQLPPPLAGLGAWPQFVTWFAAPTPNNPAKFNKFPCDWRNGEVVGSTARPTWTTADMAATMSPLYDRGHGHGVGFCFAAEDPYFFLDIDGCALPTGEWTPLAQELCARLAGAAVEVSMSGRGLHIIGRISRTLAHACRNVPLGLELYTQDRFVALTGRGAMGNVDHDCTAALELIIAQYFAPNAAGEWAGWSTEPVAEWKGPTDDDVLIAKMRASASRSAGVAFGDKVSFNDLWDANVDKLAVQWPSETGKAYDASSADMALANQLAFWTGKNCERIERLLRRSGLAREKWDNHRSYLAETILRACAFTREVLRSKEPEPVVAPPPPEVLAAASESMGLRLRDPAREYMGPLEQMEHFDGCAYVTSKGAVWSTGRAELLSKQSFDAVHGGHLFVMDPLGQKTTDSAYEALTKSRVTYPRVVVDLCFRPEHPAGAVIGDLINSYIPYACPTREGDASPFFDHLARMLPDANDRKILVSYMASMAQNPGAKFQWWPVIQGTKGNGKTLLIRALTHIVGEQYTHLPNSAALARDGLKFTGWLDRKLFIGMEEVAYSNKREFLEELKVLVTNDRMAIEKKGKEEFTGDNRANGMICMNARNGVPIDDEERRYAVFFTAQQSKADLLRDGMGGSYFPDLWDWFKGEGAYMGHVAGAEYVAHALRTMEIDAAYDPARLSHRAPVTTSTMSAIQVSLGMLEQEVQEAIEEGRPGFCGGWVSSKYLDMLIEGMRVKLPRNQRRELMTRLGYDWHPALPEGRVNDVVTPDGGKPKLYLRAGHLAFNLSTPSQIAKAYSDAQTKGASGAIAAAFSR